jgi:hypothetical protein
MLSGMLDIGSMEIYRLVQEKAEVVAIRPLHFTDCIRYLGICRRP